MRHIHVATIALCALTYVLMAVVIAETHEGWGYAQIFGVIAISSLLGIAMQHAWRELTRPEVQRTFRLRR